MQQYFNKLTREDTYGFLKNMNNWENHRVLLWLSLNLTEGPVIEFGSGNGSTPYLRAYCKDKNRAFYSYDSNKEWAATCGSECVESWDDPLLYKPCGAVLIDHAPGEHRYIAVQKFAGMADIIVIHDSEGGGAGNYQYKKATHLFKYRINYNKSGGGAGASALSNKYDLTMYDKMNLGGFVLEV